MPEDPRAKLFFDQWERDTHEGITLRSVHNRLTGHMGRTDEQFRTKSQEMNALRERIAKVEQNDVRDAEERVTGTGRHQTPSFGVQVPTPVQPIPAPFVMPQAPVSISVQGGSIGGDFSAGNGATGATGKGHTRRTPTTSSMRPGALSWLKPPIQKALGYGLTAIVAAGISIGVQTTVTRASNPGEPPPRIIYMPAPPVEPPAEAVGAPMPPIGVPLPDAGAASAHHH